MSERWERWRLILGEEAQDALGVELAEAAAAQDQALAFLYGREGRNVRSGGLGATLLTVPDWINQVHEIFPKPVIERLEKDAVERYKLEEMVTNPRVLERVEPSVALLKAVLRTRHLMNREVLTLAREMTRRVVEQLMEKLARDLRQPFAGALDRRRRSPLRVAKNFDARTTVRRNLAHYDGERLLIKTPHFYSRVRRHCDRWQLITLVDQSGSMARSVIFSAVTAAIFASLPALRSHLILFDTNVVDLTGQAADPVETLMNVQLGGGTDIGRALAYAASLVETPARTIVILISDFYEGGPLTRFLGTVRQLVESGVTLLGLAALDEQDRPDFDRDVAARLVNQGAHVGAMTPGELAEWVASKVR